jgi:hypothetical protein
MSTSIRDPGQVLADLKLGSRLPRMLEWNVYSGRTFLGTVSETNEALARDVASFLFDFDLAEGQCVTVRRVDHE